MADLMNGGNQQVIISNENDNNVQVPLDPYDGSKYRLDVTTKQSTDNAATSAYALQKVSSETVQKSFKWSESTLQIAFKETIIGSGSMTTADPGVLILNSGAASSSGIIYSSKQKITQSVTKGLMYRGVVMFPDAAIAGNIREFGLYDPTSQNGWLLRLNGTTFEFVVFNNGVATITEDASTWDVPYTLDTNLHLYEIQTKSVATGDFDIYIDKTLRHTIRNLGSTASPLSSSIDNPIYLRNENTTNATDVRINIAPISILDEGEEAVKITDGSREVGISEDSRLLTQTFAFPLMQERFDQPLSIGPGPTGRWAETIVGGAAWNQPANSYTLEMSVTTGATDDVKLIFNRTGLKETVGSFAEFEIGAKFGATLESGNRREWGFLDSTESNGVFFRVDGPDLKFVTLKGGVESVTDITQSKPNSDFHLYKISALGSGRILGFIDRVQVINFSPAAISVIGAADKRPFLRMYNTGVLAGTPSNSEFHWTKIGDSSNTQFTISGVDDTAQIRTASVNSDGRLLVAIAPPADINFEVEIDQSVAGTVSVFEPITDGLTLELKSLIANADESNAGIFITIEEDVNGDDTVLNFITRVTIPTVGGTIPQISLADKIVGTATNRIKLTAEQSGGGSSLVLAQVFGTET